MDVRIHLACRIVDGVSIEEKEWPGLVVYPNPTQDILKVDLGAEGLNTRIMLLDVSGKLIFEDQSIRQTCG